MKRCKKRMEDGMLDPEELLKYHSKEVIWSTAAALERRIELKENILKSKDSKMFPNKT